MPSTFYAHSFEGRPPERWEPLEDHLHAVARLAAEFAGAFGAEEWGRLAGLWHDLGKYRPEFQARLLGSREQVEHAGVGAALAHAKSRDRGLPLAFVIAGHHAGLANLKSSAEGNRRPLAARLQANRAVAEALRGVFPADIVAPEVPLLPGFLLPFDETKRLLLEMWVRLLFSALVDADFLATEEFCRPERRLALPMNRTSIPDLSGKLDTHLDELVAGLSPEERERPVNQRRAQVLSACRAEAARPPGLFSLTVPTGGGKTLAVLSFALRHAVKNRLERVVVGIPFTSIIEQTAAVYKKALGEDNVLEHHSALDPKAAEETNREAELRRRLAAENWDAPVVVTTNVQLFESLFSAHPSRCRKLHRLTRSVIVLDEAQTLPPELLLPVLDVLRQLVDHYGASVVFTTATQPALGQRESLPQGLVGVHEIAPRPPELAKSLRRVTVRWPDLDAGPTAYPELAAEIAALPRVLAVVHRRADARVLAERLPAVGRFHLSALMCPAHRKVTLERLQEELRTGGVCRLVSTQLIEAGVDVDFAVVYRALAGVDSLAQAAGRCNREGKLLAEEGRFVVYLAETPPPRGLPWKGFKVTHQMLREGGGQLDLLDPAVYESYFRQLYQLCPLDKHGVQAERRELNFAAVEQRFQMIEDGYTRPIVVPFGAALERLEELRRKGPGRDLLRSLQPFTVSVPECNLTALARSGALERVADSVWAVPDVFQSLYDETYGLKLDEEPVLDAQASVQ